MSATVNPILVDLLVLYGQRISGSPVRDTQREESKISKALNMAPIEVPLPIEDWFIFNISSAGISKALATVSHKKLETLDDVKTLWLHYPSVGPVITRIFTYAKSFIGNNGDRKNAEAMLRYLGSDLKGYVCGEPSTTPPQEYIGEFNKILKDFADIEYKSTHYQPNVFDVGLDSRTGVSEMIIFADEDEEIFAHEIVGAKYGVRKPPVSYEDIRHIVERPGKATGSWVKPNPVLPKPPAKPAVVKPSLSKKAEVALNELGDTISQIEEKDPLKAKALENFIITVCDDTGERGFGPLYTMEKLMKAFLKGEERPARDPRFPKAREEFSDLLWKAEIEAPTLAEPPNLPIVEDETPPATTVAEDDPAPVSAGPTQRQIFAGNILLIPLDEKKLVPNPFRTVISKTTKRLENTQGWNDTPRRRQLRKVAEYRHGVINPVRDAKSMRYSQSGSSLSQKRGPKNRVTDPGYYYPGIPAEQAAGSNRSSLDEGVGDHQYDDPYDHPYGWSDNPYQ